MKDVPVTVQILEKDNPNIIMSINGENVMAKMFVLYCPCCGKIVYTVNQPGATFQDVYNLCNSHEQELLKIASVCPKCGQKLKYYHGEVIDSTGEIIETENKEESSDN